MKNTAVRRESKNDRRLFIASAVFFGITLIAALFVFTRGASAPSAPTASPTLPAQNNASGLGMDAMQMTQVVVLSGEMLEEGDTLQGMIDACLEYSEERRAQMNQHQVWLEHPDQIPSDILFAFGSNPIGKLIYGMASYTSIEWRLKDRPAESCLLPIGQYLNQMLLAVGEAPFEEFE